MDHPITPDFVRLMAQYNTWQTRSLVRAADGLSQEEREVDRGAFFGSIFQTFNHLLWGDLVWMARFEGVDPPSGGIGQSVALCPNWDSFQGLRTRTNLRIEAWADTLSHDGLAGEFTWFSGALGREIGRSKAILIVHFFNHQTHHRGQIHAMLTAAGLRPEDTDLFVMPSLED
ncbi:MAG: DinB family protein [Pseudomonadota bacterium]